MEKDAPAQKRADGPKSNFFFIFLLIIINLTVYSNSWQASWHFDDWNGIVKNNRLHLKDLTFNSIKQTFFSFPSNQLKDKLYRPISCFTLALNWYFSQDDPHAYHTINFIIHILTAVFLFLTLRQLFNTPNIDKKSGDDIFFICALSTILWAVNPVQTQSVVYIVQRMAEMATFFFIVGIYCYLKARRTDSTNRRICFFGLCMAFFLFAILSKENAITFPFVLVLIEWTFFRKPSYFRITPKTVISVLLVIIIVIIGSIFLLNANLKILSYQNRSFTMVERLLTQPRVLIFYLSLLFYPIPTRLSLEHNIVISTSLFHPWTTAAAIIIIALMLGLGCFWLRKKPLLGFPIVFFFLNHSVESSVIPLEMIFEHRNYLPSLFLFLPVAYGLKRLINIYHNNSQVIYAFAYGSIAITIMLFGMGTYMRNMAWKTEKSLWEDVIVKTSGTHRAFHNLAWGYYHRKGMYREAIHCYNLALGFPISSRLESLKNLALLYLDINAYAQAEYYAEEAIRLFPKFHAPSYYYLTIALTKQQKWQEALTNINLILSKDQSNPDYFRLKALILINLQDYEQALIFIKKSRSLDPQNAETLTYMGAIFTKLGHYQRAKWFLEPAYAAQPDNKLILLCLINNCLEQGQAELCRTYMDQLLKMTPVTQLKESLKFQTEADLVGLFSVKKLISYISHQLTRYAIEISTLKPMGIDESVQSKHL